MRIVICVLAFAALSAGSAAAADTPDARTGVATPVSDTAKAPRQIYVCDTTAMTRRAFKREFGTVEFVTAGQARAKGEAWTAPKCITASEARRLRQVASAR